MAAPADRCAQVFDVLDLKRRAVYRQNPHRGVGGELGAILCQGKGYGQKLLHCVDTAEHQRGELADAVAERQPRLTYVNLEDFFENTDLGDLHCDHGADIVNESGQVGWFMREHAGDEIDFLSLRVAAERRS